MSFDSTEGRIRQNRIARGRGTGQDMRKSSTCRMRYSTRRGRLVAALALAVGATAVGAQHAAAVRTQFLRTEGAAAFRASRLENTTLSESGEVRVGPESKLIGDPGARSAWRLALDGSGRVVFSTGDQGKVFRVEGEEAKEIASLHNYELFALTTDEAGNVWAGGAPAGSVVKIEDNGEKNTRFTAPEGLVLDLLAGDNGAMFVATGESGRLYRIPATGDAEVVVESGDLHLRSLAWSTDRKTIWAGTDGRGLLLSIDPEAKSRRVVYDATQSEIVDLVALENGTVLFAANPSPSGGSSEPPINDLEVVDESKEEARSASPPRATLYVLGTDGSVRPFWRCPERNMHALALDGNGSVLVSTGTAGAIYRVSLADASSTLIWRAEENQVLDLAVRGDVVYAATGNPGRVYRLAGNAKAATLTSEVLDARDLAVWGMLSWQAAGAPNAISFESRSGFTATPDPSWSEWAGTLSEASGSQVVSPPGRYLQWRARFSENGDAALRAVRAAYVAANRPPEIRSIAVSSDDPGYRSERGSGAVSQTLPSGVQIEYSLPPPRVNAQAPGGVPAWVNQLRSIVWEADDPDGDELAYTLEIRQLGDDTYRVIEEEHRDPAFTLETGLLPDGVYEIRVTATDAPSNSPGAEQVVRRVTTPFQVDNVPPTVEGLRTRRVDGPALEVSGTATDSASPLRAIDVSVDGGPFRTVVPSDGLLDSARETFQARVPLDKAEDGAWVVVQVRDAAGNRGSFRAWLEP